MLNQRKRLVVRAVDKRTVIHHVRPKGISAINVVVNLQIKSFDQVQSQ